MATINVCDICGKEIKEYHTYFKFKYMNKEKVKLFKHLPIPMVDDLTELDICENCIDKIKKEVKTNE